ncbi:MAG TPA: cell wall-binding repeat-containing protein [Acidimicrobiales bacterium]|nr:cell wall-binding repeat-containing protein [Acidimicrobiales bacterium]
MRGAAFLRLLAGGLLLSLSMALVPSAPAGALTPDDPLYGEQWYLDAMRAPAAWDVTRGSSSVIVAVLDEGVDADHPDLAGKLAPGIQTTGGTAAPLPGGNTDAGTGTYAAGAVAAATSNGVGVAGLGWDTRVLPVKIDVPEGGSRTGEVAAGLRAAADAGAHVIAISLSTQFPSDPVAAAVAYAQSKGSLVVAPVSSAGSADSYPAAYEGVLGVAATDRDGQPAADQQAKSYVDIAAPTGSPTGARTDAVVGLAPGGGVGYRVGFAHTWLAAGAAALVKAADPAASNVTIAHRLMATAQDIGPTGHDTVSGAGIIDAAAAVRSTAAPDGGGGPTPTPACATPTSSTLDPVTRLSGGDRIATAVEVSRNAFPEAGSADAAVVARADTFPDALAGGPLAAQAGGPLLLTRSEALDAAVREEIQRGVPAGGTVHLLGGPAALAPGVETELQSLGFQVRRHFGEDRFATAVAVAMAMGEPANIMLTTGLDFADALAAAPAASTQDAAILLTAGTSNRQPTEDYLASHPGGTRYAIGGPASRARPDFTGIVGVDAPDTARRVAERFFPEPAVVGFASRSNFPDALGGGAHIARRQGPMLLVLPDTVPASLGEYLVARRPPIAEGVLYGGGSSVSDAVRDALRRCIT